MTSTQGLLQGLTRPANPIRLPPSIADREPLQENEGQFPAVAGVTYYTSYSEAKALGWTIKTAPPNSGPPTAWLVADHEAGDGAHQSFAPASLGAEFRETPASPPTPAGDRTATAASASGQALGPLIFPPFKFIFAKADISAAAQLAVLTVKNWTQHEHIGPATRFATSAPGVGSDSPAQATTRTLAHVVRLLSTDPENNETPIDVAWLGAPALAEQLLRALQLRVQILYPGWQAPPATPVVDFLGRLRAVRIFFRIATAVCCSNRV